ncbi:BspA family leucine-rich repeat surface protein [Flavobacteriales bacterium]|nr:BspA family leucine-rich repeat surface protein [Flavobacteriales bacterium]
MKNFIGLLTVSFLIYFSANAQDKKILIYIGSSGQYPTQSELALQLYQESNPISFQVTSQELFCGAVTETISSFDVVIFDGTSNIQDCNWIDVINQLDYFMREAGGEVIFMPNSILDDEGNITVDQYNTQSNINFILSEGNVGGVSWFEGITVTDYIDVPPFPQHGISMYNSNCGIDLFFYNSPYDAFQGEGVGIFQSVYDYPSGDIGSCETMFYTPMWYEISQTDLDDDNFFSIFEFGGDAVTQYSNFPNLLNVDNIQIAFGKQIGNGNVIFFGDAEPAWNNGSPNYNGAINLLGNIITLNVDGFQMGCIDETAYNYSEDADMDDGSCYSIILGCTDSIAYNFVTPTGDNLIDINTDDGSCMSYEEFLIDSLQLALAVFETVEEAQDYSLSLDGDDDYIDIGQSDIFEFDSSSFSVSINFKSLSYDDSRIIGNYNGNGQYPTWNIGVSRPSGGLGHLYLDLRSPGIEFYGNIDVCDGLWHNILLVRNGNNFSVFVDGVTDINSNHILDDNDLTDNTNIIIGKANVIEQEFLNAKINNLLIFNKPLNSDYIESLQVCPPTGQEEGLVGYWKFNEGSGDTVYDISGNGNHGSINGAMFSEDVPESYNGCTDVNALNFDESALCDNGSCVFGDDVVSNLEEELSVFETVEEEQDYSMSFDGLDDYVETSYLGISESNKRSISVSASNGYGCLFSYGGENDLNGLKDAFLCLLNEHNNSIEINIDYSTYQFQLDELLNWNNFTILLPNNSNSLSDLLVYQNGNLLEFLGGNDGVINTVLEVPINIGRNYRNQNYYSGTINNLIIWDAVLSQEQIQSYMSCPPTGTESGLVGFWNFNQGSGDTVYDISGNGNHGIIYGGAEFSEDVPESYKGCTDENALNFDESALCDNGSCVYGEELVASLEDENSDLEDSFNQTVSALNNDLDSTNSTLNEVIDTWQSSIDLTNATLDEVSQMNQTIASFTTLIDLQEGWNMIGYGCPESVNIEQGMSMYTDLVLLIKDNNGSVYLPEFNFNGIGDFTPGYGYQLKVSEPIEDFGLCGDYTTTESPEITDIETDNAQMQNDINCLTGNPQIGDHCYGGIVFYVEEGEEGSYGLVAALEDLEETYEWGCSDISLSGSNEIIIGAGYQNTMDILSENCQTLNGGITAASASNEYFVDSYSDWYLPSKEELLEMSILDGFENTWYWSSTEYSETTSYESTLSIQINPIIGSDNGEWKYSFSKVRPIRSFGNWTMGCMDETACNFTPEANMADGSCEYAQEGYDCDGFILITQANINEAVDAWLIDSVSTSELYDHISNWNVSNVTDMSYMFEGASLFNSDISSWDVSNVTDMKYMFRGVTNFDGDISNWDVSSVTDMNYMFRDATNFDGDISTWDVSSVTDMNHMFAVTSNFNSDLSNWDVSNVLNMHSMFGDAYGFNQDLSSWDVSSVINMPHMFNNATSFNQDLSNWDISSVTDMTWMFINATSLSEENKCAIQQSFSSNENWPYEWECPSYQVGDLAEGGIVFYVDETGEHGLVAATEDIEGTYEWGCYGTDISGADGLAVGTGYQNTLDIVSGCSETPIAASEALAYESEVYSDWYLPSKDELLEIYNTIGLAGPDGDIGGFGYGWYWSSSELYYDRAWGVYFYQGLTWENKTGTKKVRVIRAF